jgi:hypothetical protein
MLSDARRLILHLLLRGPHEIVVGVVVLSVVGLVAGTGISSLARRRREGGALAAESFPAALVLILSFAMARSNLDS